MITLSLNNKVALLIDADNIHSKNYLEQVLQFARYFGEVVICRAYGDWDVIPLKSHREEVESLGIELIQVPRIGKNATDHHLLTEAGAIFGASYEGLGDSVDTFFIASGDGDFASAVEYLKKRATVIGVGNREITSNSLPCTYDQFYFLEDLTDELDRLKARYPISPDYVRAFRHPLLFAYHDLDIHNRWDWLPCNQLGEQLRKRVPDYELRFGQYSLSTWLKHFPTHYAIQNDMIRRIDPNPEATRHDLLVKAYIETQHDKRAHLSQFSDALKRLARNYKEQFNGRRPSTWVRDYPDTFRIEGDYVVHRNDW